MILIDNLRVRLSEWNEANDEPDLVPRLRRLWVQTAAGDEPVRLEAPVRPTVGLHPARVWRLRRAS